jgi:hypothetical protein
MSPPLTPSADEARRQLQDELARPEYLDPRGWLRRLWDRLWDWLGDLGEATWSTSDTVALIVTGLVLAGIIVLVLRIAGPVRQERRARRQGVLAGEDRTAAELRAAAAELAGEGAWAEAILQRFRAIVRGLSERVIIHETPGMTAHEAVLQAADRLPGLLPALAEAADTFDALAYGGRTGTREQYETMAALDDQVQATRPERVVVEVGHD